MNKAAWKEARKYHSIPKIFYFWLKFKLTFIKPYCFHIWYKLTKYKHKHVYNILYKCLICRKTKRDLDYERLSPNRLKKWKPPKMKHGKFTKWNWLPYYPKNIIIGKNVDIGAFTFLQGKYGIVIMDNVQIGSHCSIYSEDTERGIHGKIVITKGIKIGAHSVILPRRGGSMIIKNIKAGSVVF